MDRERIEQKIDETKREITAAQDALETAMNALAKSARADKEIVSAALESAFLRVREARAKLLELEATTKAE